MTSAEQQPEHQSSTSTTPSKSQNTPILQVEFSWRKFESLVSEKIEAGQAAKPLYIIDYHTLKIKPRLDFKAVADGSIIGTGIVHPVSINAECVHRGQAIELQATSRLQTRYLHLSYNFSDTDKPVPMTWSSDCNFKTWDFICLDPNQMPVARFSANIWATKKVGNIEFLGERTAMSEAAREEIVVTGLTLFACMTLRINNFLNLFGMVAKPANVENYKTVDPVFESSHTSEEGLKGKTGKGEPVIY